MLCGACMLSSPFPEFFDMLTIAGAVDTIGAMGM